jgi:hypothetical protein
MTRLRTLLGIYSNWPGFDKLIRRGVPVMLRRFYFDHLGFAIIAGALAPAFLLRRTRTHPSSSGPSAIRHSKSSETARPPHQKQAYFHQLFRQDFSDCTHTVPGLEDECHAAAQG